MPVRWLVGNLKTGRITGSLPLVDGTWQDTLGEAGVLSGTLTLADPAVAALRPRVLAEVARTFLAAAWVNPITELEEAIIGAGPIWTHNYDDERRTLQIGAAGLCSYYDHRYVLPVISAGTNPATQLSVTGPASLGTIAKNLVQLAHTHTNGALPVVLPADETGTETRSYPGYELATVADKIRDLTQLDNGPEVAFVPRRSAADPRFIEWEMRIGTEASPMLAQGGADWTFDQAAAASRVTGISVTVDGTSLASRVWAPGAGSGESRLTGRADDTTLTAAGYPLLEASTQGWDTVESTTVLNGYAAAAARRSRNAPESWIVRTRYAESDVGGQVHSVPPVPGQVRAGDWAVVNVATDHPYLDAGRQRGRITQVSGDDEGAMTLTLQREIT